MLNVGELEAWLANGTADDLAEAVIAAWREIDPQDPHQLAVTLKTPGKRGEMTPRAQAVWAELFPGTKFKR